jgi:hypothetical protein
MTSLCLDVTRDRAARLEMAEAQRLGGTRGEGRRGLARRLRVACGTLENLARDRLKGVAADLYLKIEAAYADMLRAEIGRLEKELAAVDRAGNGGADRELVAALESQMSRIAALIDEQGRGM